MYEKNLYFSSAYRTLHFCNRKSSKCKCTKRKKHMESSVLGSFKTHQTNKLNKYQTLMLIKHCPNKN